MHLRCPACSSDWPLERALPGTFVQCPHCSHRFRVPRGEGKPGTGDPSASPSREFAARRMIAELIILLLLLLPWICRLPAEPPRVLLFIGRFHPLIVHLPIGMLLLAFLMELVAFVPRLRTLREATGFVVFLGAGAAVAAAIAGQFLSFDGYEGSLVTRHMYLGIGTAAAAVLATLCRSIYGARRTLGSGVLYGAVLTATVTLLGLAGHAGGTLTHGPGYLTHYMPPALAQLFGAPAVSPAKPEAPVYTIYTEVIDPIFREHCVTCHGEIKQKGKLRLDSFEAVLAGGKTAPAVVPGNPDQGELIYRVSLPPDELDAMPPDGKTPLTADEIALITWWVASGASATDALQDVEVPAAIQAILDARVPPDERQGRMTSAADRLEGDADLLARLGRELGANILPLAEGMPELQFSPAASPEAIGDAALAALAPLAGRMVWLDVAGSRVDDAGLDHVSAMTNLKRLFLQGTAVTSDGLRQLAGLAHLEYLNLYGTRVDDSGLRQLAGLTGLKTLYLWQTAVTADGVANLQTALPDLVINRGEMPPPVDSPPK